MLIGGDIKKERQRLGVSRDVVADRAKIARSTLQRIEEGSNVSIDTLKKVNDALSVLIAKSTE